MVKLQIACLASEKVSRAYRTNKFLDSLRILVKGGAGGMGYPKYGGIGGKGGDVYVEGKSELTLKYILKKHPEKRFSADAGGNSRPHRILGEPGADFTFTCPTGVTVYSESGHKLGEIDKPGHKVRVAQGGSGGCQENQFCGQKGQAHVITLDLKLIADVGLVGYPNAGKSSLLKAISRANPKIASYPFTTICPNIGILKYDDLRQISLADLPGLIEGAHGNFGLGHRFLKHVERTKMLLFVIDINGFRLNPKSPHRSAFETVMLLNRELELYREDLAEKPALLAINKIDTLTTEKELKIFVESVKNAQEVTKLWSNNIRPKKFLNFDEIIPISAANGNNVEYVKKRIREVIDLHDDLKRDPDPEIKSVSILVKKESTVQLL